MRKIITLILCLLLLSAMTLTGFATGDTLSVTDAKGKSGDTVYLTVTLNTSVSADALGVKYTYDKAVLKAVPDSSTWTPKGSLQNFGNKDLGVWATTTPVDLNGPLCVLAFRVKDQADFTQTQVTCEVTVRNGSKEVGVYTATATISNACTHNFGQWQNAGKAGHTRTCDSCQAKQTKSHQWDEGKVSQKADGSGIEVMVYTCQVCGATQTSEMSGPTTPAKPESTTPSKETTAPTTVPIVHTKPTQAPQPVTQPTTEPTTLPTGPTVPLPTVSASTEPTASIETREPSPVFEEMSQIMEQLKEGEYSEEELEHDHDHDHAEEETDPTYGAAFAVLGVLVAITVAAIWFVKKKH